MKKKPINEPLSINRISTLTGLDRRTLAKRLADAPVEKTRGKTKFYSPEIALMAMKDLRPRENPNADLEREKIKLQVAKLHSENEQASGGLIPVNEVRRDLVRYATELKRKLLAVPKAMAQRLALETDALAIEEALTQSAREVLTHISTGKWAAMDCPHCKKEITP